MNATAVEPRVFAVTYEARGWTANKATGMHWADKGRLVAEWRDAFAKLARHAKVPHLDRIAVTVVTHLKGRRAQDIAANFPAVKAGIDGLVDARVIPDDDAEHLVSLTFLPPIFGAAVDELTLVVAEVAAAGSLFGCSGCGRSFIPKRRPAAGKRTYCPDCGPPAARRDASRDYRGRRAQVNGMAE